MTYAEVLAELMAKHPKADLSPSAQRGSSFDRANRVTFKKEKGFTFAGRDADGTEVMVYYNDTANVIACTEIESFDDDDE